MESMYDEAARLNMPRSRLALASTCSPSAIARNAAAASDGEPSNRSEPSRWPCSKTREYLSMD